jgi:hypothetical protein
MDALHFRYSPRCYGTLGLGYNPFYHIGSFSLLVERRIEWLFDLCVKVAGFLAWLVAPLKHVYAPQITTFKHSTDLAMTQGKSCVIWATFLKGFIRLGRGYLLKEWFMGVLWRRLGRIGLSF